MIGRALQKTISGAALVLAVVGGSSPSATSFAGTQHVRKASLVLDWTINSDHGGLFVARERGYFRNHRIEMTAHVPSDTTAQIKLVASGSADFGISYESDLLAARAHGIPARSVMCIMQHPLNTVMSLRGSHIRRPRELSGKTVGMAGSPSDYPIVRAMVTHDGGTMRRVRMVNVGYSLLPALLARRVDAVVGVYWTWESIEAQRKGHAVDVLRVEKWGVPNYCELVLVAGEKSIRNRPGFVRDVVRSLQQGYAYAAAHPNAAWRALRHTDPTLNGELVKRSLQLLRPLVTDGPTVGYQSPNQWRRYEKWVALNKLIDHPVEASQAFTNRFLAPHVK